MSVFFFRLLFFSKIVDHLRKCATILGRERYFLILIAKNRENVFFLIKLLANTVFLLIFLLYHNNFLPFCVFLNWREKIAFKSSHFNIITFFFKIQLSFFILPFSFLFFCWDFVLNKGHFHVLSIFVIATNFENQTANVAWNLFL